MAIQQSRPIDYEIRKNCGFENVITPYYGWIDPTLLLCSDHVMNQVAWEMLPMQQSMQAIYQSEFALRV